MFLASLFANSGYEETQRCRRTFAGRENYSRFKTRRPSQRHPPFRPKRRMASSTSPLSPNSRTRRTSWSPKLDQDSPGQSPPAPSPSHSHSGRSPCPAEGADHEQNRQDHVDGNARHYHPYRGGPHRSHRGYDGRNGYNGVRNQGPDGGRTGRHSAARYQWIPQSSSIEREHSDTMVPSPLHCHRDHEDSSGFQHDVMASQSPLRERNERNYRVGQNSNRPAGTTNGNAAIPVPPLLYPEHVCDTCGLPECPDIWWKKRWPGGGPNYVGKTMGDAPGTDMDPVPRSIEWYYAAAMGRESKYD